MPVPFHALRFPIAIDASTGRLAREPDYDTYIRQLIRQVLLTAQGERINRPTFGAGLRHMVLAPNSPATASLVQTMVYQALTTWLGTLISTDSVTAAANNERLDVTVAYTVRARGERRELSLEVTF
jgi:phage baseplate assembly protein W